MFINTGRNLEGCLLRVRVVDGSMFDGTPYQIALEDGEVGLGSSARIRKGSILGDNPLGDYITGNDPLLVAVKVFGELLSRNRQELLVRELRFCREVSLRHEYILPFIGTATLGEQTAIVSLYMKNGRLLQYIQNRPDRDKKELTTISVT